MELNFKEGMFLGKQELERQRVLEACFEDSISRLIVGKENLVNEGLEGLYAPQKLNYKLSKKTIDSVEGIAVSAFNLDGSLASLGRLIVGKKNGQRIGVVTDSGFTGKECFLPLSEFIPADPSGHNGLYFIFRLKPATTNYELSLISVSSSGVGTFSIPSLVMPLFREATGGRATTIKTSSNQVLKVASVDLVNNKVQFEGTSFTAETNVQFMFLQTLSPFATDTPQPLYTYSTCELICDATGYADWKDGFIKNNVSVPLGYALYYTNGGLQDPDTPSSYLGIFLDTVGKGQITSEKIVNEAVVEEKIADEAVTRRKLGNGIFGDQTDSFCRPGHFYNLFKDEDSQEIQNITLPQMSVGDTDLNFVGLPAIIRLEFGSGGTYTFVTVAATTVEVENNTIVAPSSSQGSGESHWAIGMLVWYKIHVSPGFEQTKARIVVLDKSWN